MAKSARPTLNSETLETLARNAHLDLSPEELTALLPPTAAIFAALDALDTLEGLQVAEPAARFVLEA